MNFAAPVANYPRTSGDREAQLLQRIMRLEQERDRLADELADLRAAFGFDVDPGLSALGFNPQESTAISVLLKREVATHDQVRYALWPSDANARAERDPKYTHILACRIRARLAPHGIPIDVVWGKGYRIPEADKARLRAIIAAAK